MKWFLLAAVMSTLAVVAFNTPGFSGFDQMTETLNQLSTR